ncbi:MAG: protein kinase domain-containing protein, partial [Gemmatimonadales bacterium]
ALGDRYRIEREIGRGGMATVLLAQDLRHDRPVALKVLHPELGATLGAERFHREVRLVARLQHPHILTVLDSGEAAGQLWFTMPYVVGESLRDRLRREHQLPLDDALRIAREAADALDYAHRQGVLHRDIKPENILLTERHALVSDFGVARALRGDPEQITETGVAVGTPAYMSPEQATGERELDARSDVYGLGCVLYEMLAGEAPFTGPTAAAVITRAMTETPRPLRATRSTLPAALDGLVARALARSPADRFATAAEFAAALETVARPASSPVPQRRQTALPVALALGFLLGLGVLFAWLRTHPDGGAATTRPTLLAVLPFENLGRPDQEYFADGVTDAVRGKLASLPGVEVVARSSSNPYKGTTKALAEIGKELGVDYLLTGTVRWEQIARTGHVQVSPELVQVGGGGPPTTRWQQPFDAVLSDVFQVQADIAGRVAQELDLALGSNERAQLAERPTANLAAYDAFLRGEEVFAEHGSDPTMLRRALAYYGQAIGLDSTFAAAWARLSRTYSTLYFVSQATGGDADRARAAADKAHALAPNRPDGLAALGEYQALVAADPSRALEYFGQAQRLSPDNAEILTGAALAEWSLGRWEAALEHLRHAHRLDPRSSRTVRRLGFTLLWLRRYREAREAFDRGLAVSPTSVDLLESKAMVFLAEGDLTGARRVLQDAPREVDATRLVAYVANYWDLFWLLDDAQQTLLLRLAPGPFGDNRGAWG